MKLCGCLQGIGGSAALFWDIVASKERTDTFWLDRCSKILAASPLNTIWTFADRDHGRLSAVNLQICTCAAIC